jgi:uncharacterized SAM-binding protein YcdF (DUF218 family)
MARVLGFGVRLAAILCGVAAAYLLLTFIQVWQASLRDEARPAQALVVLGAAQYDGTPSPILRARLDHAVDLVEREVAPILVVTGGRRTGDRFTEATASANYLYGRGVSEATLRREVHGRNSWEQLAATARFLRTEGISDVVLVSDPYHSYRIAAIAEEVGMTASVSPAMANRLSGEAWVKAMAREAVAVAAGRVVSYRRLTGIVRPLDEAVSRLQEREHRRGQARSTGYVEGEDAGDLGVL